MRYAKFTLLCLLAAGVHAQEPSEREIVREGEITIPERIPDGTMPRIQQPPRMPSFKVVDTQTRRLDVVEAPPMPGLPAVVGEISVTVRKVEDPGLPPLPEPLPATDPEDPAVIEALRKIAEKYRGTEMLFVSASVYDGSRTLLRVHPNGKVDDQVAAWSNLDFRHFSGFSSFRVTADDGTFTDYGMLMGVSNTDTAVMRRILAEHGHEYKGPEIPELPKLAEAGPRYLVVEGGVSGSSALSTLALLHELYAKEGVRMERAFLERERIRKEREAYYRANPPEPKDVILNYWRGSRRKGGSR